MNRLNILHPGLTNQLRSTKPSRACKARNICANIMAPSSSAWPGSTDQGGTRWIGSGKAASSPSRKYVNLIHVEDLAAICLAAIEKGKPGEAYNVSDGTPRTWNEICATAQQRWGVTAAAAKEDRSSGKRISNAKLRAELGYTFKHPDLYEALALIESGDGVETQDGQNGFQQGPRREEPEAYPRDAS